MGKGKRPLGGSWQGPEYDRQKKLAHASFLKAVEQSLKDPNYGKRKWVWPWNWKWERQEVIGLVVGSVFIVGLLAVMFLAASQGGP